MGICQNPLGNSLDHPLNKIYPDSSVLIRQRNLYMRLHINPSKQLNRNISHLSKYFYLPQSINSIKHNCQLFGENSYKTQSKNINKEAQLVYDLLQQNLQQMIRKRQSYDNNQYFKQKQLWNLLYIFTRGYFQLSQQTQIDTLQYKIDCSMILIKQNGSFSVILPQILQKIMQQSIKVNQDYIKNIYSPQKTSILKKQHLQISSKLQHSYKIGIIILCAGNLCQIEDLCNKQNIKCNNYYPQREKVSSKLQQFGKRYSCQLYNILYELTAQMPQNRSSLLKIYHKFIKPYQKQIAEFQEFFQMANSNPTKNI